MVLAHDVGVLALGEEPVALASCPVGVRGELGIGERVEVPLVELVEVLAGFRLGHGLIVPRWDNDY